jgi:hypothetical protein
MRLYAHPHPLPPGLPAHRARAAAAAAAESLPTAVHAGEVIEVAAVANPLQVPLVAVLAKNDLTIADATQRTGLQVLLFEGSVGLASKPLGLDKIGQVVVSDCFNHRAAPELDVGAAAP